MTTVDDFVPTRGSSLKRDLQNKFQVLEFKTHKPKRKSRPNIKSTDGDDKSPNKTFDMKKAKYEVIKFGMSGLDTQKKEEVKMQLAIKLGAKPPKNKYTNYKELLLKKRQEKFAKTKELELQSMGKIAVGNIGKNIKNRKNWRQKKESSILDVYGTVNKK